MKLLAFLLLALSVSANADFSGSWYDADHPGHGIQIDGDSGFGHAVTWYLHRKDGSSAFLSAVENCEEFPCAVTLVEPSSSFLGGKFGGAELDLGNAVGSLELTPDAEGNLIAEYNLRLWLGEDCGSDVSPGGLLFRGCIGKIKLSRLTY